MKYKDAAAFRMALEQRLKDRAGNDGAQLARDRKRVAFDRLLVRLIEVAKGRWLLKGGFALELRLAARARSTKDIDIEWRAEENELLDALLDAPNDTRTTLGANALWQVALLELWLQSMDEQTGTRTAQPARVQKE